MKENELKDAAKTAAKPKVAPQAPRRKAAASTAGSTKKTAAKKKAAARKSASKTAATRKTSTSKSSPSKAPVKKAATGKVAAKKKAPAGVNRGTRATRPGVTPEERWQLVAKAAYLRAEARQFTGGKEVEDWLAAEAEVDADLRKKGVELKG